MKIRTLITSHLVIGAFGSSLATVWLTCVINVQRIRRLSPMNQLTPHPRTKR